MRGRRWWLVVAPLLLAACSSDGVASSTSLTPGAGDASVPREPDVVRVEATTPATSAPDTSATITSATITTATATSAVTATSSPSVTTPATTTTAPAPCAPPTRGLTETVLSAGGAEHPLRIVVPSSFSGHPLPVVIDWHGLGSNGPQQASYSGYEALAEEQGFIAVHPTGVADAPGGANSWQLFPAPGRQRDDLAFAGSLIDELVTNWCADPARVYSTGMSNGGFFTARLICAMADRIAAAVSVAGTYHPESCRPARAVPYMAIHGTADKVVPYLGGESTLAGTGAGDELRVFFEQVMPDEFAEFAADAGCDATTVDTGIGDDVIEHEYTGCDGGTPMIFDEVQGGGHTWPSSPMAALTAGALGYTTDDIDATRDGWAFMSQSTLGE